MYERKTAEIDADFVVFLIGLNVNRWTAVRSWQPAMQAMPRMLSELRRRPDLGLLKAYSGWMFGGPASIQYWRSYEDLVAYSRSTDSDHLPAWRAFNRAARKTDAVGIWHETYRVTNGQWETIYGGMTDVGLLGAVGGRSLDQKSTSAMRIGDRPSDTAPVDTPPSDLQPRTISETCRSIRRRASTCCRCTLEVGLQGGKWRRPRRVSGADRAPHRTSARSHLARGSGR